ncbi:MAG: glycosyltransferase [Limnoraphis sp. WC205]|jgi:colanic acid/amylovoran biosynthesis glycosyltransferase|nr:glycosyltransferase [Limnoraphis sp. WC205]
MKIAFIVGTFPSLSETFILNQITGLIERGHQVDIYADSPQDQDKFHADVEKYQLSNRTYYRPRWSHPRRKAALKGLGLFLENFPKNPPVLLRSLNVFQYKQEAYSLRLLYAAIPMIGKKPYDIIHCHFGQLGQKGVTLREIGAIQGRLITSFHGADVNSPVWYSRGGTYKKLFKLGDKFTVNSNFTADRAIALGCPPEKIVKLPMGLNLSLYQFKARYLQVNEPVKIITVARLVEKKGIEYSIRAVAQVLKEYPNLIYRIVGDGGLRESLEQLIRELNVSENVKILGWMTQEEVRQLYTDSHLFILSSVTATDGDKEGQGLVLQEAEAMGLPVLSTIHNGIPDGVLDGKSGFLVPEKDVSALAEKLRFLLKNPEKWLEMGQAGRAFVEENYEINKLNDQLVEIYSKLIEK